MIKYFPAIAGAAQISAQMGTPFSFQKAIVRVAKMMNLDWIDEIFQSPELVAMMAMIAQRGPQAQDSKGAGSPAAIQQNKGPATAKTTPSPQKQQRQTAQAGANDSQKRLAVREK